MWDLIILSDHLLPVLITVFFGAAVVAWFVGKPYLLHTHLVVNAIDDKSVIKLAKHLAHKCGGIGINVDAEWESFVPAAKAIRESYKENRIDILVEKAMSDKTPA